MNIPSIKIRAGLWFLLLTGLILAGCAPKQRAVDDSFAFGNDYENLTGPERSTMTPEERFAYDYRSAAVARMRDEGVPLSNVHLVERAKTAIGTPYVRGGTSMSGGKGNMVGTAFGAILMATIKNGLSLLNVNTFWHQVVIGIFILFAVALDGYASTRAARNG